MRNGLFPGAGAGEEKNWVGRWRQPSGSQAVVLSLLVLVAYRRGGRVGLRDGRNRFCLGASDVPADHPGRGEFWALRGIAAALVAGFALGPYMPMHVAKELRRKRPLDVPMVFFLLVGRFSGLIRNSLTGQIDRLQEPTETCFSPMKNSSMPS